MPPTVEPPVASTELIALDKMNRTDLFKPLGLDPILNRIKAEVDKVPKDISTEKARKALASLSRKIASSRVRVDELGKEEAADLKKKAGEIDAERKRGREFLQNLQDETRKPLDEFEAKEEARIACHEEALTKIIEAGITPVDITSEGVAVRIQAVESFSARDFQEFAGRYAASSTSALATLQALQEATLKREKEQAELAELRRKEAIRQQEERDAKIAADAVAKTKADAEEATSKKAAEREAAIARQSAASALAEEESKRKLAEAAAEVAKAVEEAKQAVEEERKRVEEQAQAEIAETAKREANRNHRASINRPILMAMTSFGLPEAGCRSFLTAVAKGEIANIKITY